jgi:hypothetical protein
MMIASSEKGFFLLSGKLEKLAMNGCAKIAFLLLLRLTSACVW